MVRINQLHPDIIINILNTDIDVNKILNECENINKLLLTNPQIMIDVSKFRDVKNYNTYYKCYEYLVDKQYQKEWNIGYYSRLVLILLRKIKTFAPLLSLICCANQLQNSRGFASQKFFYAKRTVLIIFCIIKNKSTLLNIYDHCSFRRKELLRSKTP